MQKKDSQTKFLGAFSRPRTNHFINEQHYFLDHHKLSILFEIQHLSFTNFFYTIFLKNLYFWGSYKFCSNNFVQISRVIQAYHFFTLFFYKIFCYQTLTPGKANIPFFHTSFSKILTPRKANIQIFTPFWNFF